MATLGNTPIKLPQEVGIHPQGGQLRSILKRPVNIQPVNNSEVDDKSPQADNMAAVTQDAPVSSSDDERDSNSSHESDQEEEVSTSDSRGSRPLPSRPPFLLPPGRAGPRFVLRGSGRRMSPQARPIANTGRPLKRSATPPRRGSPFMRGRQSYGRGSSITARPVPGTFRQTILTRSDSSSNDDFHSMEDEDAIEDASDDASDDANDDDSDSTSDSSSEGQSNEAVNKGSDDEDDESPEEESDGPTRATSFSGRDVVSKVDKEVFGMAREGDIEAIDGKEERDMVNDLKDIYDDGVTDSNQNWFAVEKARAEVHAVRELMQKTRKKLLRLRDEMTSTDNAFMQLIRPLLVPDHEGDIDTIDIRAVNSRFDAMQRNRTDYQTVELEYEALEQRLEQAEQELERVERKFFNVVYQEEPFDAEPFGDDPGDLDDAGSIRSRLTLRGIPPAREQDIHPTYMQLMNTAAKLTGAKEALEDLRTHIQGVQEWEEKQKKIAEHNPHDSAKRQKNASRADWEAKMNELIAEEKELVEEVSRLERRRNELKELCLEKDLMPAFQPVNELWDLGFDVDHLQDDMTISVPSQLYWKRHGRRRVIVSGSQSERLALAHPEFTILLSNPSHLMAPGCPPTAWTALKNARRIPMDDPDRADKIRDAYKEAQIERLVLDSPAGDKNQFINRWLLQRLRTSPYEVHVMYNTFTKMMTINNTLKWQSDVLYWWSRDKGNHNPIDFVTTGTLADTWERNHSADGKTRSDRSDADPSVPGDPVSRRVELLKNLPKVATKRRMTRRCSFSSFQGFEAYTIS